MAGGKKKCNHIIAIGNFGWQTKDIRQQSAVNTLFNVARKEYLWSTKKNQEKDICNIFCFEEKIFSPDLILDKRSKHCLRIFKYCPDCGSKITSILEIKKKLKKKWHTFRFIKDL